MILIIPAQLMRKLNRKILKSRSKSSTKRNSPKLSRIDPKTPCICSLLYACSSSSYLSSLLSSCIVSLQVKNKLQEMLTMCFKVRRRLILVLASKSLMLNMTQRRPLTCFTISNQRKQLKGSVKASKAISSKLPMLMNRFKILRQDPHLQCNQFIRIKTLLLAEALQRISIRTQTKVRLP